MDWLLVFVSVITWLTPAPAHAYGRLVRYGPQYLVEANADYRGYDLSPYPERCGVAAISPANLGQIVWVRLPGGDWQGPCLAVDVAARSDFARIVYYVQEIVEVSNDIAAFFGFEYGIWGEAAFSVCPPSEASMPKSYQPRLQTDDDHSEPNPLFWPYPEQQLPQACD